MTSYRDPRFRLILIATGPARCRAGDDVRYCCEVEQWDTPRPDQAIRPREDEE